MKRVSFFLFLIILLPIAVRGQESKMIKLEYDVNDFVLSSSDGKTYISSAVHSVSYMSDPQCPALPYIGVNVLISPNSEYVRFSYSSTEQIISDNVEMTPNPIVIPTDGTKPLNNPYSTEFKKNNYPEEAIIYTGTHIMDGYHYLSFLVCPFRYEAEKKDLFLKNSFRLSITLNNNVRSNSPAGKNMRSTVHRMIVNGDDMDALYPSPGRSSSIDYEYLIITNNTLRPAFQRLADWKTQKGIRAKVLTTEEIYNTYSGSNNKLRIKQAIKDYYNGSYSGLKYVLLGGTSAAVPTQQCYIEYSYTLYNPYTNERDTIFYNDTTPTDLFYACFDTMEWNTNGNNKYGEICDSVDIDPEIIVTRLPASNIGNANDIVDRIISYERNPVWENWADSILMSGAIYEKKLFVNGDSISDAHQQGNLMYNGYIAPYWSGQRIRFYDTGTDFEGGSNYILNAPHLQDELRKGYHFFNMDTHGNTSSWKLEMGTYSNFYADTLHNSGTTIIVTSACDTNGFDFTQCLSRSFLNNSNSGVLAYFGSSRKGWRISSVYYLGNSNQINADLFRNLFTNGDGCFAKAAQEAKLSYLSSCYTYENTWRWLLFSVNTLCDPEMPVYLSAPQYFTNVSISITNNSLYVNAGVSGCRITAMSLSDNGISYYDVEDNVNNSTFSNIPSDCSICITKPGYIPYIVNYSDIKYIQNEVIDQDMYVAAGAIHIGSDVTNTVENGPVSVESGKTTLYGNSVFIKNNFEVKAGAQFEIK